MITASNGSYSGESGLDSVALALDLLLEEIERERDRVKCAGADALYDDDHRGAEASLVRSKALTEFYGKAAALRKEWQRLAMSGRQGTGRRGPRRATKRMLAHVEHGRFWVQFTDDEKSWWDLPDPTDKEAIRHIRDEAVNFALAHGASNPGQTNAVKKALTDAGYYLRKTL